MIKKVRLDQIVHNRYSHLSRTQIQSFIMQGKVCVDGLVVQKPGILVKEEAEILCDFHEPKYVSRAGFKLERALEHFGIDVTGLTALDAGISTGGFTDCLLQHGVEKVFGIDVGYGQVHEKIRNNPKVVILERTNLRTLGWQHEKVDLVTLDLSFISMLKVMDSVCKLLKDDGKLIVLIKPQFEADRSEIGRGGIVKDAQVHKKVIEKVVRGLKQLGFRSEGIIDSPILGGSGNKEFLGYFQRIV